MHKDPGTKQSRYMGHCLNCVKIASQDFEGKTAFIFPCFPLKKSIRTNRTMNIAFRLC